MIPIPHSIKLKLIELDQALQELGRMLYGRKIFGEYVLSNHFHNFQVELHADGSFTLHFQRNILGHMEHKHFQGSTDEQGLQQVIDELEITISLIRNKLKLVSA